MSEQVEYLLFLANGKLLYAKGEEYHMKGHVVQMMAIKEIVGYRIRKLPPNTLGKEGIIKYYQ